MATPLKVWPQFAHALGIDPNSPQAIVAGQYRQHHGPLAALQRCWATGKTAQGKKIWTPRGASFPVDRLSDEGGIFWRPACPGGHIDDHFTGASLLFYEIDDRSMTGQWEALDRLTQLTGLEPAAVVFSGGKSLHVYFKLDRPLSAENWKRVMRKLAIVQQSDPQIVSLNRMMRLPGAKRFKGGQWVEQAIERLNPEASYSPEAFEAALDRLGLWPHGVSDERWRLWQRQRGKWGHQAPALVAPDEVLFPKRDFAPIEPIAYDGQTIPLERCLSRRERDWLASGIPQGERNANGLVLGRSLIGAHDWLTRNGYRVDGNPEALFWDCLGRSGLGDREINTLWRQCNRGNPRPSVPEDGLIACVQSVIKGDRPKRSKSVGFKPVLKAKAVAPKDGAIILYHSSYAATGRGRWSWAWPRIAATISYQPGCLPSFELWQRMDRPKICYQPQDRKALWLELWSKGYTRVLDTSEAGGGKTHTIGEFLIEVQAEMDRDHAIAQTDHPDEGSKRSRAALLDPDHRNPSTDTTAALTPYPSKHGGLVITREGKVRVAGSNTPEDDLFEPANCPSATIHQHLSQEGVNAPIGPEHPVCVACPAFRQHKGDWSCPVTEQVKQAQDGGAWVGHPAAVPVADGSVVAIDEADKTIVTERTRNTDYPNQEWGRMQTIAPTLYEGLMADGVRSAQDRLTALAGKSKHGLDPLDTRATFLGALPLGTEGMFDPWGDGGAVARFNRVLGQSHMVYLGMFGAIEGNPTDLLLPADPKNPVRLKAQVSPSRTLQCSRFPRNVAEFIGRLGGNPLDTLRELGDRAASPAMAKAAINDAKSVRAIGDLLQIAFSSPKSGTSIAADTYGLTITTRDRSMVKKLNRADFVLLADATGKLKETAHRLGWAKETAHRFGWAADSIVEIQAIQSDFTGKLKLDGITGAGSFGADRRDESEFCAGQRVNILRQQVQALHADQDVAIFDKLAHLTGDGIEGAYFRDSRKSNDYCNCIALLMIGRPTPNLMAMASIYEVRTGEPVEDPLGRWDFEATNIRGHRRYCRWLRSQVIKETVQTIARLRSQHGNSEKVVYLAGDWPQWLIDGVLAYFPGAAFTTQTIHQFCPEAAPKGSQTRRKVIKSVTADLKAGIDPTLDRTAARTGVSKGLVSQIAKAVAGGWNALKQGLKMLFRTPNNKTKPHELPPEVTALAETLKQLSIDLLDGTIAPDDAREQLAAAYIESGETVTAQAIEALPDRERRALHAIVDRSSLVEWLEAQVALYGRARVTGNRAIEHLDDRELARIAVDRHW
jgi:hypothetical protein